MLRTLLCFEPMTFGLSDLGEIDERKTFLVLIFPNVIMSIVVPGDREAGLFVVSVSMVVYAFFLPSFRLQPFVSRPRCLMVVPRCAR